MTRLSAWAAFALATATALLVPAAGTALAPVTIAPAPANDAAFDPLTDPAIHILTDVDDTDFDDILNLDDDTDNNGNPLAPIDGLSAAPNLTRRRRKHRHHGHHKHKHNGSKSKHPHRHSRHSLHISTAPDPGAKLLSTDVYTTWYSAHDLLNPACGSGKWQPTPRAHVAAVSAKSKLKCGQFLQLCATNKKRCVKVRVVDACPGCKTPQHIDLSKSAFLQLATGGLDQGEVHGVHSYDLGTKVSPWAINLFGGKLDSQGHSPW